MSDDKKKQLEEAQRKHAENPSAQTQKEVERLQKEVDDGGEQQEKTTTYPGQATTPATGDESPGGAGSAGPGSRRDEAQSTKK